MGSLQTRRSYVTVTTNFFGGSSAPLSSQEERFRKVRLWCLSSVSSRNLHKTSPTWWQLFRAKAFSIIFCYKHFIHFFPARATVKMLLGVYFGLVALVFRCWSLWVNRINVFRENARWTLICIVGLQVCILLSQGSFHFTDLSSIVLSLRGFAIVTWFVAGQILHNMAFIFFGHCHILFVHAMNFAICPINEPWEGCEVFQAFC